MNCRRILCLLWFTTSLSIDLLGLARHAVLYNTAPDMVFVRIVNRCSQVIFSSGRNKGTKENDFSFSNGLAGNLHASKLIFLLKYASFSNLCFKYDNIA